MNKGERIIKPHTSEEQAKFMGEIIVGWAMPTRNELH